MRIRTVMIGAAALGVVAATALTVVAKRAAPPMIAIAMKWQGQYEGPANASQTAIQDAATFQKSWAAGAVGAEEAKKIDFAKHTVLAVATGTRNTGGYSVAVTAIYDVPAYGSRRGEPATEAHVSVSVEETMPGNGAGTTQALTNPWQVVVIPKTDKPVKFHVSKRAAE